MKTLNSVNGLKIERHFWQRYILWILLVLVATLFFASKITIKEQPLGNNNGEGEGYYLVTKLLGTQSVYSFKKDRCFSSGAWECGMIKQQVKNADVETFKTLGLRYAADVNYVYFDRGQSESNPQIVTSANIDSLVVLDTIIAKDDKYVYFGDSILSGANPADYKILAKDERQRNEAYAYNLSISGDTIFLGNRTIDYALRDGTYIIDPELKGVIPCENEQPYTKEEHKGYYACNLTELGKDEVVAIDTSTFKIVSSTNLFSTVFYAKDSRYVYHLDFDNCNNPYAQAREKCNYLNVIEGADPVTFRIDNETQTYVQATDNYHTYSKGGCKIIGARHARRIKGHLEDGRCFYY